MTMLRKTLLGAIAGAGALAFFATGASAEIVCSGNTCWHVKEKYEYPPTAGIVVHEDAWSPVPGITFREHEGRGYWRGDVWTAW